MIESEQANELDMNEDLAEQKWIIDFVHEPALKRSVEQVQTLVGHFKSQGIQERTALLILVVAAMQPGVVKWKAES